MNITKPTIGGAIASISKGIKQLDAVIDGAEASIAKQNDAIAKAADERDAAETNKSRAARIKAKLEELIA